MVRRPHVQLQPLQHVGSSPGPAHELAGWARHNCGADLQLGAPLQLLPQLGDGEHACSLELTRQFN